MPVWLLWLLGGAAALRIVGGSRAGSVSYNQVVSAQSDPRFFLPPGSTYRGDPDGSCPFGDKFYLSAFQQSAGLPWCIRAGTVKTGIPSKVPASVRVFQLTAGGFEQSVGWIKDGVNTINQLANGTHKACKIPVIGATACAVVGKGKTAVKSHFGL